MSLERLTKQFKKEDGVTLVELLAAIAILSIIVTAFLAYFTQAANTNNHTDKINEATFLAQNEMENVTIHAYENNDVEYIKEHYFHEKFYDENNLEKGNLRTIIADNGMKIETKIYNSEEDSQLYKITVKVWEGEQIRAKMETRIPLENTPTEIKE